MCGLPGVVGAPGSPILNLTRTSGNAVEKHNNVQVAGRIEVSDIVAYNAPHWLTRDRRPPRSRRVRKLRDQRRNDTSGYGDFGRHATPGTGTRTV